MPRRPQTLVQLVTRWKASGMVCRLDHPSFNFGHKRCRALRIVQRDEVADLDKVQPGGGQNDQARHGQDLAA